MKTTTEMQLVPVDKLIPYASGRNVYIDSDSVDIRSGSTVLADFKTNEINLGKNSDSAVINMCNDNLSFSTKAYSNGVTNGVIQAKDGLVIEALSTGEADQEGLVLINAGKMVDLTSPQVSLSATKAASVISNETVNVYGNDIYVSFDNSMYINGVALDQYQFTNLSKYQYYHIFGINAITFGSGGWNNFTTTNPSISLPAGSYLVQMVATIAGSSTSVGLATIRWFHGNSSELPSNHRSRQTVPINSSVISTFNLNWIWENTNGGSFVGWPQIYATQNFSMRAASVMLTRIGNTFKAG